MNGKTEIVDDITKRHIFFIGPLCPQSESGAPFISLITAMHRKLNDPRTYFIDGGGTYKDIIQSLDFFHIGDGDSSKELGSSAPLIKLVREKDESDLLHGLRHYHENTKEEHQLTDLHFFGFLGGELSHQLAVFGDCYSMLRENEVFVFYDNKAKKKATLFKGKKSFKKKGLFSVFTFSKQNISIFGEVTYQTDNKTFVPLSSLGLHNESIGPFSIESNEPTLIIWD